MCENWIPDYFLKNRRKFHDMLSYERCRSVQNLYISRKMQKSDSLLAKIGFGCFLVSLPHYQHVAMSLLTYRAGGFARTVFIHQKDRLLYSRERGSQNLRASLTFIMRNLNLSKIALLQALHVGKVVLVPRSHGGSPEQNDQSGITEDRPFWSESRLPT